MRTPPRPVLVAATPGSGAALAHASAHIDLTFAAPLDPARSGILVVDESMAVVNDQASTTVTGPRRTELRTRVRGALRPGAYTVSWTAAAPAGPRVRQAYLLTVGPPHPPLLPDHPVSLVRHAGPLTIRLAAPPDRVAHQTYTITLSAGGRPVSGARVRLVGRAREMDMGAVPVTAQPRGSGRYVAVADVVMASDWQVTVTVQRGRTVTRATFSYLAHY